jgi:hypothetical protein
MIENTIELDESFISHHITDGGRRNKILCMFSISTSNIGVFKTNVS